ncbi:hypothetical protein AC578_7313 [Pseudocercospora eumusae]|uniref:Uncharacterized protein n=1 Tax=Pseudocercospora eumusae TaxID=321146 RepID=A0A139HX38_9PEZI|nr:hypothetical protein AC578_7313 [Pseudocercospora eumusae]
MAPRRHHHSRGSSASSSDTDYEPDSRTGSTSSFDRDSHADSEPDPPPSPLPPWHRPGYIISATVISLLLLYISMKYQRALTPPCHVRGNPNHLPPCALFPDLNRIFRYLPCDPSTTDCQIIAHPTRIRLDKPNLQETSLRLQQELVERIFRDLQRDGPVDYFERRVRFHQYPLWLQRLKRWAAEEDVDIMNPTKSLDTAFQEAAKAILHVSSRTSKAVRSIVQMRQDAQTQLEQIIQLRSSIDESVQEISTERTIKRKADPHHDVVINQKLDEFRLDMADLLIRQASLQTFISSIDSVQSKIANIRQSIKEKTTCKPFFKSSSPPDHEEEYFQSHITNWLNTLQTLLSIHSEHLPAVQKSSMQNFTLSLIEYCIPGEDHQLSDPFGSGCPSHPDPVWWEWHNASPIRVQSGQQGRERRIWTRFLRATKKLLKKKKEGYVVPLNPWAVEGKILHLWPWMGRIRVNHA